MACSAYISYELDSVPDKTGAPTTTTTTTTIRIPTRPRSRPDVKSSPSEEKAAPPTLSQTSSTAFVLVDPSAPKSSGTNANDAARTSIRKHASKACAARRLATIAAKKKSRNVLTKRERQKQLAAERLEAALQQHAQKLASSSAAASSAAEAQFNVLPYLPVETPTLQVEKVQNKKKFDAPTRVSAAHKLPTPDSDGSAVNGITSRRNSYFIYTNDDQNALAPPLELDQKQCSFSWILDPPKPASMLANEQLQQQPRFDSSQSPRTSIIHTRRLDPFSTFPVDFEDDGKLRWFMGFLAQEIYDLMDLRLPTKFDKAMGTRYAHSRDLPHFVFSSEPLFWTMALCAATILALQNRKRPGAEPVTMGYRYLAIRSVNQRLNSLGENGIFDVGLIYAIASLGVWEREKGSRAVWHSHCQGIEMLSKRLRRASQHHLVEYMVSSCQTTGSVPIEYEIGEGFRRMGDEANALEPSLIAGIYECGQVDQTPPGPVRSALMQGASSKLLTYRVSDAVAKAVCGSKDRSLDGDRMYLEMHVLLQGAGSSFIRRLVRDEDPLQEIDLIDFDETCLETVKMAEHISNDVAYDELLLWAALTIFALNGYAAPDALAVLNKLVRRLGMVEWRQVESSLRLFVYLDSQDGLYKDLWAKMQRQHQARRPG